MKLRRLLLATAALAMMAAPPLASGCGGGFTPISKVDGLRVLGVVADKPFANPGDTVTLSMSVYDGYVDPNDENPSARPIQILWLGGCFDPPGDAYYGCYPQLAEQFKGLDPKDLKGLPPGVGVGESFSLTLPDDIISRRPKPRAGSHYGIAYVFFAACAGTLGPVTPEGNGRAPDFPLGCFDANGTRLGAESFVPGYTQVYAFADGRTNANPPVNGFTIDDEAAPAGPENATSVKRCNLTQDDRDAPPGCGTKSPYDTCKSYELDVDVSSDVAETDPEGSGPNGTKQLEVVWVDYFAEKGDVDSSVKLVNDSQSGLTNDHTTRWIPPEEPGLVSLWAVVHDARGGSTVVQRYVRVE